MYVLRLFKDAHISSHLLVDENQVSIMTGAFYHDPQYIYLAAVGEGPWAP